MCHHHGGIVSCAVSVPGLWRVSLRGVACGSVCPPSHRLPSRGILYCFAFFPLVSYVVYNRQRERYNAREVRNGQYYFNVFIHCPMYSKLAVIREADVLPLICLFCIIPLSLPVVVRPYRVHTHKWDFLRLPIIAGLLVVMIVHLPLSLFNCATKLFNAREIPKP